MSDFIIPDLIYHNSSLFEFLLWVLTIFISTIIIVVGLIVERKKNKDDE